MAGIRSMAGWRDGRHVFERAVILLLLLWASQSEVVRSEELAPCPGAAAWRSAHGDQLPAALAQRDEARSFTAPDLRADLERRFDADQRLRVRLLADPEDHSVGNRVREMDRENLAWLKNLMQTHGIPTVAQVGESGVHWSWLLVQHADDDPRFQLSVQPVFAQCEQAGELPAEDLARLTDRVLLAAGKPQRFGTQFDWYGGRFKPKGAADVPQIDANRRTLGLMPLADYACMMNARVRPD